AVGVGIEHAYPEYTKHAADIGGRVQKATGSNILGIGAVLGTTLPLFWAATKAYDLATGK
ncbi:MAG: hypothetical protein Q7U84_07685, partial [Polynucleobacter sp.]|nr:hypothetical protein [Polynucleobacter sp.]